jgi:hypothetical protein
MLNVEVKMSDAILNDGMTGRAKSQTLEPRPTQDFNIAR